MSDHSSIASPARAVAPAAVKDVLPPQEYLQNDPAELLLQTGFVQFKLAIGAPDDPLEHEADAMADTILRMPSAPFSMRRGVGGEVVQRTCAECEEEKVQRKPLASFIQRKESSSSEVAPNAISSRINASKGNGSSMDNSTQTFMQNRFGTDFSDVKIHTGGESVQMNRDLNAKAFTIGKDIYFNEGQYNPNSNDGKHLLAHELTHTVQQGAVESNTIHRFTCTQILNSEEQTVNRGFGVRAHQVITQDFRSQFPGRAKGFRIPGATSVPIRESCGDVTDTYIPPLEFFDGPEPSSNRGVPDLAYIDDNRIAHLAEIKIGTYGCRDMAERQVARYADQGNMDDPEMERYRSSPHMRRSLRNLGLTGPLEGFTLMDPGKIGYHIPESVTVDGVDTKVAGCGNGVIIYKNIGEESEDRHLCDQSPEEFIDRLIQPAEEMVDNYIDNIVNPAINQLLDTLSVEEMITLAYMNSRPAIQQAVTRNFGELAWQLIASMDDQSAVRYIAQLIDRKVDTSARAVLTPMIRQVKDAIINSIRQAMHRMLRNFILQLLQQLCQESAAVSLAVALQAISRSIGTLFRQVVDQMIEQAVLVAAAALAVVTIIAVILVIVAVVVVVAAIVLLLPEILAALGIGGGVGAAGVGVAGTGTALTAGTIATGTVIGEGVVTGSVVTSTGVTLTVITTTGAGATTTVAAGTGGGGTIAAAAAAVLLYFGLGDPEVAPN